MPDETTPPEEGPTEDQTPDEPEQNALKVAMLAEVQSDLPAGIADFLTTPLPAKAALTDPVDVDSAIICQAQFCVFLNDLFGAYEGLTPIQIPMFMAQLNTVQQGMLLASLEAAEPTEETPYLLTVTGPLDGGAYKPGELRVTASADKEQVRSIEAALNGGDAFSLRDVDGDTWRNYLDMAELGDYTLTVTATLFDEIEQTDDMGPLEQTIAFSIADDAEAPAEGADKEAVEKTYDEMAQALQGLFDIPINGPEDLLKIPLHNLKSAKTALETLWQIGKKAATGDAGGAIDQLSQEALNYWEQLYEEMTKERDDGEFTSGDFLGMISGPLGDFMNAASGLRSMIEGVLK